MSIIVARCSFSESRQHRGSLKVPYESTSPKTGKVMKRAHKVVLLPMHTLDDELSLVEYFDEGIPKNIVGFEVDYTPTESQVRMPVGASDRSEVPIYRTVDWVSGEAEDQVPGVTTLAKVEDLGGPSDYRHLVEYSRKNPNFRILPEHPTLRVDGLRIGYFDADQFGLKPRKSPVTDGKDDRIIFTTLSEIEGLEESAPAAPKASRAPKRKTAQLKDFTAPEAPKRPSKPKPAKVNHAAYLASKTGGSQIQF